MEAGASRRWHRKAAVRTRARTLAITRTAAPVPAGRVGRRCLGSRSDVSALSRTERLVRARSGLHSAALWAPRDRPPKLQFVQSESKRLSLPLTSVLRLFSAVIPRKKKGVKFCEWGSLDSWYVSSCTEYLLFLLFCSLKKRQIIVWNCYLINLFFENISLKGRNRKWVENSMCKIICVRFVYLYTLINI